MYLLIFKEQNCFVRLIMKEKKKNLEDKNLQNLGSDDEK